MLTQHPVMKKETRRHKVVVSAGAGRRTLLLRALWRSEGLSESEDHNHPDTPLHFNFLAARRRPHQYRTCHRPRLLQEAILGPRCRHNKEVVVDHLLAISCPTLATTILIIPTRHISPEAWTPRRSRRSLPTSAIMATPLERRTCNYLTQAYQHHRQCKQHWTTPLIYFTLPSIRHGSLPRKAHIQLLPRLQSAVETGGMHTRTRSVGIRSRPFSLTSPPVPGQRPAQVEALRQWTAHIT